MWKNRTYLFGLSRFDPRLLGLLLRPAVPRPRTPGEAGEGGADGAANRVANRMAHVSRHPAAQPVASCGPLLRRLLLRRLLLTSNRK